MKKYVKNTNEKMYKKVEFEFDKLAIPVLSNRMKTKVKKTSKKKILNKKLKEYKEILKNDEVGTGVLS